MCLTAFDWRPNGNSDDNAEDEEGSSDVIRGQSPQGEEGSSSCSDSGSTSSLVLVFNRDEYYSRPCQTASFWSDQPNIYAGRDLLAGGTWLATRTHSGQAPRFACLTNYDSADERNRTFPFSRGDIVTTFVGGGNQWSALQFANEYILSRKDQYAGFNVLLFDGTSLVYCSNRHPKYFVQVLSAAVYGLSNHLLDTPWPKVEKVKQSLTNALRRFPRAKVGGRCSNNNQTSRLPDDLINELFSQFEDPTMVEDRTILPTTFGEDEEHMRSAIFVNAKVGGTRTTTIVSYCGGVGFDIFEKTHSTPNDLESSCREFIPVR
jgi:uncharacterized protein with NRDE domain